MTGRPGRRRLDHTSPLVDLDAVFADDALIDSIVAGTFAPTAENRFTAPRGGTSSAGRHRWDPIDGLFTTWRQELDQLPLPAVPSVRPAVDAVAQPAIRDKRSMRSVMSVAAAIAALLIGSTTVGSKDAAPDSAMWGITKVLWPDRAESVASRSTVREALDDARLALDAGNDQEAQLALLRATAELGNVDQVDGRNDMQQLVADMWVEATDEATPSIAPTGGSAAAGPPSLVAAPPPASTPPTSGPAAVAAALAAAPPAGWGQTGGTSPNHGVATASIVDAGVLAPATPFPSQQVSTPVDPGPVSSSPATSTSPPSATSTSDSSEPQPPSSPPSTVPPPSVPNVPINSGPKSDETSAKTAPAESAPVPVPTSSWPDTELSQAVSASPTTTDDQPAA